MQVKPESWVPVHSSTESAAIIAVRLHASPAQPRSATHTPAPEFSVATRSGKTTGVPMFTLKKASGLPSCVMRKRCAATG